MTHPAPRVTTTRFEVPETLDDPRAADLADQLAMRNAEVTLLRGDDDDAATPAQMLPVWQDESDEHQELWLRRVDGELVATASIALPHQADSVMAYGHVRTRTADQGRGHGRALAELIEGIASDAGRTVLQGWSEHRAAPGPSHAARSGAGALPLDRTTRFALGRGFQLEQVFRMSALDADRAREAIPALLRQALPHTTGYVFECWELPTPTAELDGVAHIRNRMSTDAPGGDAVNEEEAWDAAREARHEQQAIEGGYRSIFGVMRHEASGAIAALNELCTAPAHPQLTHQEYTLVLAEHRGHRLGMAVKCLTLAEWLQRMPNTRRIETHNAEENRPMLAINEAMGFTPVRYSGRWQKRLGAGAH